MDPRFKEENSPHQKRTNGMLFAGIAVLLMMLRIPAADAAGFNVNSDVTFTPLVSTYRTTNDTTGCSAGFAGKFTFSALLTNKPTSAAMPGVTVRVLTLTNGNVLLDPQSNQVLGGAGAEMAIPKVGQYRDGLLSPGESVETPFVLCLKTFSPFQFLVDVFGVVTQLVSVNRFGTGANDTLGNFPDHTINVNGRFVAFVSVSPDLAANDLNGNLDVFVRDVQAKTTVLASINKSGTNSGNAASGSPALSADGRLVAFASDATDLAPGLNSCTAIGSNVFVRDLQAGSTRLVSVDRTGTKCANGGSELPSISTNGRYVAFLSKATDLLQNDITGQQVYVRDLQAGTTRLASVNVAGTGGGNGPSGTPRISADGRFVAFSSYASDLAPTDTNGTWDVFVRDLQLGTTTLVSVNQFGTDSGNAISGSNPIPTGFAFSTNGRFIAFESKATDLVSIPASGLGDVFVRDLQSGVTTMVSVNRTGTHSGNGIFASSAPAISADGQFVAFQSSSSDLVANDTNGTADVFLRDILAGTTTLVSVNVAGTNSGNFFSFEPSISANGRFVAFSSRATDLVTGADTNGGAPGGSSETTDVFVRDWLNGVTQLVSVNRSGTDTANAGAAGPRISADGRFVAFVSASSNLVAEDTVQKPDVFIRPVQ